MNRSEWPRLCVSDGIDSRIWIRFCTWLGIHRLYLKWLEFARVVRVSVEIVVEGFEYLQNTGSQLILFKR